MMASREVATLNASDALEMLGIIEAGPTVEAEELTLCWGLRSEGVAGALPVFTPAAAPEGNSDREVVGVWGGLSASLSLERPEAAPLERADTSELAMSRLPEVLK